MAQTETDDSKALTHYKAVGYVKFKAGNSVFPSAKPVF
jgi:hypothetical protein